MGPDKGIVEHLAVEDHQLEVSKRWCRWGQESVTDIKYTEGTLGAPKHDG
jgi:hypothetical protein